MAVRLYPLCSARRVTAPQAPLTTAAALPIHSSTGKVSIVVSLHDPSDFSLGLIRRLTCYRAAKLSTRFPQKTGVLRRSPQIWFIRELSSGVTLRSGWLSQQDQPTFEAFLAPLKHLEWPILAVLSDKQTGLVPAVAEVLPNSHHQF